MNNYSTILILLDTFKSLFCFLLDIGINDILNYRTNHLQHKCRKKAIASKQDCLSTRLLMAIFHEITIKTQLVLLNTSTNHNVGSPRSLHFKFCQMIYLFNTFQKHPPRGVPRKWCSENMQKICRRRPMSKCDFNKVVIEITLRHRCSPLNLVYIFRTPFLKNTFERLLLTLIML